MVLVEIVTFAVKLALLAYIIVSAWYPIVSVNRVINLTIVKAVLLFAIVLAAMYDVPLAILLTVTMVVAVVSEGTKSMQQNTVSSAPAKAGARAPLHAPVKAEANLRIYDQKQASVIPVMHVNTATHHNENAAAPLTPLDQDIIRISHVPEDRLASVQTSALDPDLIGYEEELVATVDMPTLLLSVKNETRV